MIYNDGINTILELYITEIWHRSSAIFSCLTMISRDSNNIHYLQIQNFYYRIKRWMYLAIVEEMKSSQHPNEDQKWQSNQRPGLSNLKFTFDSHIFFFIWMKKTYITVERSCYYCPLLSILFGPLYHDFKGIRNYRWRHIKHFEAFWCRCHSIRRQIYFLQGQNKIF